MTGPGALDTSDPVRLAAATVENLPAGTGGSPYLLIAEHAGRDVPAPWKGLGLAPAFLETHFAVDLGVAALTRRLAEELAAPALLSRISRLFLDFNRPDEAWDLMRPDLGGIPVPGNQAVDADDRSARLLVARQPLDEAILAALPAARALVSIHSFTPVMNGERRAVDLGILWKTRSRFVAAVCERLAETTAQAGLRFAENAPYDWRSVTGYTLDRHGEGTGRPCFYLEARNSLLADPAGLERVTLLVADAMRYAKTHVPAICQPEEIHG